MILQEYLQGLAGRDALLICLSFSLSIRRKKAYYMKFCLKDDKFMKVVVELYEDRHNDLKGYKKA
jgi:hypothetical protein